MTNFQIHTPDVITSVATGIKYNQRHQSSLKIQEENGSINSKIVKRITKVPLLSYVKSKHRYLLKKPLTINIRFDNNEYIAENERLGISVTANTAKLAMCGFIKCFQEKQEFYNGRIDIITNEMIKERHKKAWEMLADM